MNAKVIVAGVITVVMLVIGIQLITSFDDRDPDTYPEWQYDDYKIINGVSSVSGSLEIVTVGSTTYVHAKDLGDGEIIRTDGSVESIKVDKAYLDVFLMTGQSNAAYFQADKTKADPVPAPGTAYYYGTSSTFRPTYPDGGTFLSMTASDGSAAIGDKATPFAAKYYELTGHKVYWICGATGGRAIATFQPTAGTSWAWMQSAIYYAMGAIDTDRFIPVIKSYMWIQGEWDKSNPVDYYVEEFLNMNSAILKGKLGIKPDHCFIAKVATKDGGNASIAQVQLARDYPDIITMATEAADTFTVDNGLMASDDLHYSQLGDNIIGVDLAESIAEWYKDQDGHTSAKDILFDVVPILLTISVVIGIMVMIYRRS